MQAEEIITAMTTKIKTALQNHTDALEQPLTAAHAENVVSLLTTTILAAAGEGFKTYLQQNETQENTIFVNGEKYQFNRVSNKEFHTSRTDGTHFGTCIKRLMGNKQ
jgi:hypothetical protein